MVFLYYLFQSEPLQICDNIAFIQSSSDALQLLVSFFDFSDTFDSSNSSSSQMIKYAHCPSNSQFILRWF